MSSQVTPDFLQQLQPEQLKTAAARRFADFCLQDFPDRQKTDAFEPHVYADAASLVVARLEATRYSDTLA